MGPRPRPRDDGSLMSILGILFLVLGLLISVGIHELGHMIPAKKFGVKVSQYFIGFGPTLWSKKAGGTEYGIKALPLGGFVKIAGMIPPGRPGRKELNRRGKLTLAEEARRESASEIGPGEETRAFWQLSAPKKLIVMFGGPLTNLVLCFVCLAIVVCGIGLPKATSTVGKVVPCVTQKPECAASDPKSPAAEAGLRAGDEITSWGGRAVKDWKEIQAAIAEGGTDKADVVVRRGGATMTLSITPIATKRPKTDASGKAVKDARGETVYEIKPYVGISPTHERRSESLMRVPGMALEQAGGTAKALARLPVGLWQTARSVVTGEERSASGVVGIVGVADLAGDIASVRAKSYDWPARLGDLLLLLGSLNMTLFIFNLIPLLPLDGGHLAGATFEGLRRSVARRRRRPDPGPIDTARLMPLSYTVAIAFIVMTVILVVADVVNPVKLL